MTAQDQERGFGQSFNFGLGNLDTLAWIGHFSAVPDPASPEKLIPNVDEAKTLERRHISAASC